MTWDKMIKCHALPFSHSDIVQSEPGIIHPQVFSLSLSYYAMFVALSTYLLSNSIMAVTSCMIEEVAVNLLGPITNHGG